MHRIAVIRGDGVGSEVINATLQVLNALPVEFNFVDADAGYVCYQQTGTSIPDVTLETIRSADATLFGAVTTPPNIPDYKSAIITIRKELDLFANLRPIQGITNNIDLLIVRENTEGLYSGIETREEDRATSLRVVTRSATERIMRKGIEYALDRNKELTIVHKANILRESDGLFREVCLEIAQEQPEITVHEMLVDAAAMNLVRDPHQFDVIVTTNLFGDILSDLSSQLIGGMGMSPSGNIGTEHAVFEPVHGSAPDIAGQGIVNPTACMRAAVMMLEYLEKTTAAEQLNTAIHHAVLNSPTKDMGGTATTNQFTTAVVNHVQNIQEVTV